MDKKIHSVMMLALLLIGILTLAFNIQRVKTLGTIYIRPDGSIDPPTAPIQRFGDLYALADNINADLDGIVIQRDNIVVDGAGYMLQGAGDGIGIHIGSRTNVTIRDFAEIRGFSYGIKIEMHGAHNNISRNNITNNEYGIWANDVCDYTTVFDNNILANRIVGIYFHSGVIVGCTNCTIMANLVANNGQGMRLFFLRYSTLARNTLTANDGDGIQLHYGGWNDLIENYIAKNWRGIHFYPSSLNRVHHNSFVDNTNQIIIDETIGPSRGNVFDDGYPSGGNYWSDYEEKYPDAQELDDSGIWDTPYVINENNQDNYPLMEPWTPTPPIPTTIDELKTEIEEMGSGGEIDNHGIVTSLIAKLNVAQKLVDKGKIDEAKSILEEDFIPQVQNLSDIHITPEAAELLIESAEYIISHL